MWYARWVGLLVVLAFAQNSKKGEKPTNLIQFAATEHNFGKVKEEDRTASTRFTFKNISKDPVRIIDVKTSCGCTTPNWSKDPIPAGKEGFIEAQYSTWGRPGEFVKSLTVQVRSEKDTTRIETYTLTLKGEVLPRPLGPEDWYPTKVGSIRFGPANHASFGTIKTNEKRTLRITMYNDSDSPVEFKEPKEVPAHLKVAYRSPSGSLSPTYTLKPKDTFQLEIEYNAAAANDYGFVLHTLRLPTNDSYESEKPFYVTANIEEYFGELTEEALASAPKAQLESVEYNYGKIKAGTKVEHTFRLTNVGKKPLIIRKVRAGCGCTVANPDRTELKPGESTTIKVTFDSTGRSGHDEKVVTVILNDPRQPTVNLRLYGDIEPLTK